MKFWLKIFTIFIYFISIQINAQDLNRRNLILNFKTDKETSFVINGIPYLPSDSVKVDIELSKISPSKISNIVAVKKNGENYSLRSDFIVINNATQLPKKLIRKKFKEIKTKFKDIYLNHSQSIIANPKDPVLNINGKTINPNESKVALKKLSKSEIAYIYYSTEAVKVKESNSNYKNGSVIIWTKDKLN